MTDFFLTYRDFLNPTDLCRLLISRFYWALKDDEESRKIVRIRYTTYLSKMNNYLLLYRTFVVFRHWLNNYFVHDFIGNRPLRVILTTFLNELPHHPLVRQSPRDQRIVKILKRVLRRLKKLYYQRSSGASRVKVIPPPPPTAEQEQMGEIVRAKLSQSAIRRKTAIGLDMSSHYHGNMAVQDARYAPVVVVGSLNKKSSFIDSGVESSSVLVSRFLSQQSGDETSMHYRYDKNVHKDKSQEVSSVISVTSDDSLESEISAGDTIPNESDESDDEYHYGADSQTDDEHDREWAREQEETLEYFRLAKEKNFDIPEQQQLNQTSECSSPSTPTTPELQVQETRSKEPVVSKTIHRVPSERWCKSDDLYQPNKHPLDVETLPTEILQELSENETRVPTGLSKRLSRKSIERRKSEKSLNEASTAPSSTATSPHLAPQDIPQVPELPAVMVTKKRSLKKKKSKANQQVVPVETFAAIPYESTQVPEENKEQVSQEKQPRLTRVLSKVFKHEKQTPEAAVAEPVVDTTPVVASEPVVEQNTATEPGEQQQSSQLVSLIARRLRYDSIDESIHPGDDTCECSKCSGNKDSSAFCRRLSIVIMPDEERRQSLELRRRRGASMLLENKKEVITGPMYLGNLHNKRTPQQPIDDDEVSSVHTDVPGTSSVKSLRTDIPASSVKSIQTDFPASSVRARMSIVSDMPPRSKMIEIGLQPEKTPTRHSENIPPSVQVNTGRCFIMSYRTSTLASQFCFVERDVLVKVGWEELIHCKWTKMDPSGNIASHFEQLVEQQQQQQHISYTRQKRNQEQGIEQVIQRFNTVCQWVATEIVRTKNTHERVKLIEKFIKLAKVIEREFCSLEYDINSSA